MKLQKVVKRIGACTLAAAMLATSLPYTSIPVEAAKVSDEGFTVLGGVESIEKSGNVVTLTYVGGEKAQITFLENNIFRFNLEPAGEFLDVPVPNGKDHVATIVQQLDDSDEYSKPEPKITEGDVIKIESGDTVLEIDKATSMMRLSNGNSVVWEESAPLKYGKGGTSQTLKENEGEYFYGGGTQNGRFSHKGKVIKIENQNNWVDNGVASPNPFYWSTNGYGVLRNTWKPGEYDFGNTESGVVETQHTESRFDAYYFVDEAPTSILQDYYKVTGNPAFYPEYAFYLGHLNCYNRDAWKPDSNGNSTKILEDGNSYIETNREGAVLEGETRESLNDDNVFSARTVVDGHVDYDMPFGWILPNDGYGCGYGRTNSLDGNVANLKEFSDYNKNKGVVTGLWTQSDLTPNPDVPADLQRDLVKEVEAGVRVLKTDVAWVGPGYSFALNGIKFAYDTIAATKDRPTIVTLDGWGGTQRYGGIWTGDQTGGEWEYIRFHIPTYIGTGLSGQPNIGSDMDGIFGGDSIVQMRDFQWKAFTPLMLDMDGWGTYPKKPYYFGDNTNSVNRMYLKLKAELMPYIYTTAQEATNGKPMIRAMMLEYPNDPYTYGTETQYQYMWGSQFLVAPIYQSTAADDQGNDIRNDIYLPDENQIWIDYFTGKQYRGGSALNNFDAPYWKLPLFVKNGSIIPMYTENNNVQPITDSNPKGLDKTKRVVEFYPDGKTEYTLYEDNGNSVDNTNKEEVKYGSSVTTRFTSDVIGKKAVLTAEKSNGSYNGYDSNRQTTFVVNVSEKPSGVSGSIGSANANFKEVTTQDEFDAAAGNVYFYNETPNLNKYGTGDFADVKITTTPKLYVKTEKTDVNKNAVQVVVDGFVNDGKLVPNELDSTLSVPANLAAPEDTITPTQIKLTWDAVEGAAGYEVMTDGVIQSGITETSFVNHSLPYDTPHTYRVRAVGDKGHSEWSAELEARTILDPYRNVPKNMTVKAVADDGSLVPDQGGTPISNMVDGDPTTVWHTKWQTVAIPFDIIIDMKRVYTLEKFEYLLNGGNGNLQTIDFDYSIDGKTWKNALTDKHWADDYDTKGSIFEEFKPNLKARYIKIRAKQGVGQFGSGAEFRPYTTEGDKGILPGDVNNDNKLDEGDIEFFKNYTGLKTGDADFGGYVETADINYDGLIDAYDIAYVLSQLNGGTNNTNPVSGQIALIPSKTEIKAGETFSLNVYGMNMQNVNAFSMQIPLDTSKYEYVNINKSVASYTMESFFKSRTHTDATTNMYVTASNIGAQQLINGTEVLGKVTLKAKTDTTWDTAATNAKLVGPGMDFVDALVSGDEPVTPEVPAEDVYIGRDAFDVTFTNSILQTDDGTNHEKLWQQSFEGLFDRDKGTNVEFKWFLDASTFGEEVKLPTDFNFDFGEGKQLKKIAVYNRNAGTNGLVTSISAKAYVGNTEIDLGTVDHSMEVFEFTIPEANKSDAITKVVITPQTSQGTATGVTSGTKENRMLTLREIEFFAPPSQIEPTEVVLDENNKNIISVGRMVPFSAMVAPENVSNPYYEVTSSDPTVVKVMKTVTGSAVSYSLQGLKEGTATITAAAAADDTVFATMDVAVTNDADTTALTKYLAEAKTYQPENVKPETYQTLQDAIAAAEALDLTTATQDDVDNASIKLRVAILGLAFEDTNPANRVPYKDVKVIAASSEAGESPKEGAADDNPETIWHTDYSLEENLKMPASVKVDLGREYDLTEVGYLARQDGGRNGDIVKCAVYVSTDNETYEKVTEAEFRHNGSQLLDKDLYKSIKFNTKKARFVKFEALETLGSSNNAFASIAELEFYGTRPPVAAAELTVDPESATLNIGDVMLIKAEMEPYDTTDVVTFTSGDEGIVTVDENGLMRAIGAGTATITVAANENVTKTVEVTVKPANYDELVAAIAEVEAFIAQGMEGVHADVSAQLSARLGAAKTVIGNAEATDQDVTAAYKALMDVYGLTKTDDLNELGTLIEDSKKVVVNKYDQSGHEAFTKALDQAVATYTSPVENIGRIVTDYNALQSAKQSLVTLNTMSLSMMADLADEMAEDLSIYKDGADKDAFVKALEDAKNVINAFGTQPMTQAGIDTQTTKLKDAIKGLQKNTKPVQPDPEQPGTNDANGEWVYENGNWWFKNDDGSYPAGEWKQINGTWYAFGSDGYMLTGWIEQGGTWYYADESGAMQTGWVKDGDTWYYTTESGAMQTGWVNTGNTWYYTNASGAMQTGWVSTGDTWYYTNESGAMQTGWVLAGGVWYYTNESGAMQTGWVHAGGTWYYMAENGAMQTGWVYAGNNWYYMAENGAMQTGWVQIGVYWYYLSDNGSMVTGWLQLNGTWYYMNESGIMLSGRQTINGVRYVFSANGALL